MKQPSSTLLYAAMILSSQAILGQSITPQTYGTAGISEVVHHFTPAIGGGFFLTGADFNKDAGGDSWVVCTDATGKQRWQWSYGGAELDGGNAILALPDGGALMVGHSESYGRDCDGIAARFDTDGHLLWHVAIGEAGDDAFYDAQLTADGGFLCIGLTENYGAYGEDAWLVKLDAAGNVVWTKHYGGLWNDFANKITPAKDGGYWLAGVTFSLSFDQRKEISLLKIDPDGELLSSRAYHLYDETVAYALNTDADGNIIVAGTARQNDGNFDAMVTFINAETGVADWIKTFGGTQHDEFRGVTATSDGNIVVAGYSDNLSTPASGDAFVLKLNHAGEEIWLQKAGGKGIDDARGVYELADGNLAIAGKTAENESQIFNGYLMTLHTDGITLIDQSSPLSPPTPIFAPNPVSANGTLQWINPMDFSVGLRLFDLKGNLVLEQQQVSPDFIPLENYHLLPGVYLAEIKAGASGRTMQWTKLVVH
jgi:uncharacterized delta-60 repeat protein